MAHPLDYDEAVLRRFVTAGAGASSKNLREGRKVRHNIRYKVR
jgi:hypothetical protein